MKLVLPRSLVRSAIFIMALALPSVVTADVWDEAYSRGLNAIKAEDYKLAVQELERAIAADPNEFISDEQPRNGWTAYLPHFWLGVAKFHLGDLDDARAEWKISEQQGVVPKNAYYAGQLREWKERAATPIVVADDPWVQAYLRGVGALRAKNYELAAKELQRAIGDNDVEFISVLHPPKYGLPAYLPHFYLGIAKFHLGDVDGAVAEWKISERQGVVPGNTDFAPLLREWMERAASARGATVQRPTKSYEPPPPVTSATIAPAPAPTTTTPIVDTTTSAPPSFPVDEQLGWDANIAFNTPDQIALGEHHVLRLLLDIRVPANELERQLHTTDKTATATIRISDTVEARLTGAAFDIRSITPELQPVSAATTTEWLWEVTPKEDGNHRLFLTVNAIVGSGADQRKRSIRTFDRVIEVRVPPRPTSRWTVPIFVLAGILIAAALLLFLLRVRKSRSTPRVIAATVEATLPNSTPPSPTVPTTVPSGDATVRTPASSTPDPAPFREGQLIAGRYRIVRLLGQGGMGAVYAAQDGEFDNEMVALKTILAPGENADRLVRRFKKEIQLARRVAHPNVSRIFDVGYHVTGAASTIFVSMEYVAGVSLKTFIEQKGRLTEQEALAIIRDVAAALDATHAAGLVHRDIKSANVMLADAPRRAVLMDFGVACLNEPDEGQLSITKTGAIIGTPAYMAPEQLEGAALTPATDIYAFGMVIYEMVTGRLPYEGDTPMKILAKRLRELPRSPAHFVPDLKPEWERAILKCLEHDPSKRFQRAMDVHRALDRAAYMPTLPM